MTQLYNTVVSYIDGLHRCYKAYLYKYGNDVDEMCLECRNERETAQHVFFTCPKYVDREIEFNRVLQKAGAGAFCFKNVRQTDLVEL